MNKKILKSIIIIGIIGIITLILTNTSDAASLSVKASKSSVSPGESFTVTVTLSDAAGPVSATVSGGSGSLAKEWLENSSKSFTCTAGSSGTVTITASGTVGDFATGNDVTVRNSTSVTIVVPTPQPEPTPAPKPSNNTSNNNSSGNSSNNNTSKTVKKSDNSNLSSIQIAEGVISPEFSKTVKEYTVNVPYEVTKLSIAATPEHSKGTVTINGNDELKVGENLIEIIVTAEDSSTDKYTIKAIRAKQELSLQTLSIYYVNGNGEKVELKLDPQFSFDVYSYAVNDILAHTIQSLSVEAKANAENAKVEIVGNDELKSGTNEIAIKVSVTDEAGLEEQKTYTIKVQKEEEPVVVELTTIQKIQNFFGGFGSGTTKWISSNFDKIITGMLLISTSAFVGLTIYFACDYKNYQKLLAKLASYNKENLMERANVALKPENSTVEEVQNIEEKEDKKAKLEELKSIISKKQKLKQQEVKDLNKIKSMLAKTKANIENMLL